jgi:CBS domain-containing protein
MGYGWGHQKEGCGRSKLPGNGVYCYRIDAERVGPPGIQPGEVNRKSWKEEFAMDKPRKTAKQLLDMKKQAGFFSVSANSTVKAALEVLSEKNIGAVLVMEGTKLVGIFSERDYARKGELQGRTAGSTAIREVMTSNIASVTPDQMVEECRRIMGERRIRHLPVLDGEKVIGVLSSKDILDEVIAEDEKLIHDLETERLQMTITAGNY